VLLLSSVTSCTSWLLASARMADVENPSDFSFSFVLKSCSALRLVVPSFLRLAGIPLDSQRILIVFSGSEPNTATRAEAIHTGKSMQTELLVAVLKLFLKLLLWNIFLEILQWKLVSEISNVTSLRNSKKKNVSS
jgi:hypothetical protein